MSERDPFRRVYASSFFMHIFASKVSNQVIDVLRSSLTPQELNKMQFFVSRQLVPQTSIGASAVKLSSLLLECYYTLAAVKPKHPNASAY